MTSPALIRPDLPQMALSVRQPWAWAICHAGKQHENRSWGSWNHHLKRFRGPLAIHASSGMTRTEYQEAADFMVKIGRECPPAGDLIRGAIVCTVEVTGWVRTSHNPWFMGPGALVLERLQVIDPIPCSGALGYFEWREMLTDAVAPPLKWMLPKQQDHPTDEPQGRLL